MDSGVLRRDRREGFWRFVRERQRVWVRRVVLGEPPPWTVDEALRRHRFTNVYRVLDPGTQYAIHEILDRDGSRPDRLFNTLLYRLVGRSASHAHVGFQRMETFDVGAFESRLRDRAGAGEPVFTGAYLVSGYAGFGGDDKIETVARLFDRIAERFDGFYAEVEDAGGPEDVYAAIRSLPGFGNFLAYQILVDLRYPLPGHDGEPFLPFSSDAWAAAGPGAQRGIAALTAGGAKPDDLAVMQWLWANQDEEFERFGITFDWLRDVDGDPIRLSLADVQNCCCEFYKYRKVVTGEGRTRRRFRSAERRPVDALLELYDGYPISVDSKHYTGESSLGV